MGGRGSSGHAATAEDKVRSAYRQSGGQDGSYVNVTAMHDRLEAMGMSPADADRTMTSMYRSQQANLVPQENQARLSTRQRAEAIRLGGEDKHRISIPESKMSRRK